MRLSRIAFLVVLAVFLFASAPLPAQSTKTLSRIAFGSCARENKPQPIWKSVVAAKPQVFLFVGDNIYGDTQDMKVLKAKYGRLGAQPGYKQLLKTCPVMATWDDHDYGVNDGGEEYAKRVESQQVFCDFFKIGKNDPRRKRPGIYHAQMFGPEDNRVQIILLDTRYFRSPLKKGPRGRGRGPYAVDPSPDKTILGEAQWKWLEQQLRIPAKLRIVCSSIQVVSEDHGWEKWMNISRDRERLFKLIRDTKAEGVIFLSGDRHLAELSMMDGGVGYPLYDLTSSGLNQGFGGWRMQEKNRHRVATMNFGDNFGLILVDWERKDPLVRLQIRDADGDIAISQKIPLSVLKQGKLPLGSGRAKLSTGEELTPAVAKANLNQKRTVVMKVRATGESSKAKLVFLNSAPDRKSDANFTIVIDRAAQDQMKKNGISNPRSHYLNKMIQAEGTISEYQGQPQIIVSNANQVRVIDDE